MSADRGFAARHIGPNPAEREHMLERVGYADLAAFTAAVVPEVIRWHAALALPPAASEPEPPASDQADTPDDTLLDDGGDFETFGDF